MEVSGGGGRMVGRYLVEEEERGNVGVEEADKEAMELASAEGEAQPGD